LPDGPALMLPIERQVVQNSSASKPAKKLPSATAWTYTTEGVCMLISLPENLV
jgi:hypothetical protein